MATAVLTEPRALFVGQNMDVRKRGEGRGNCHHDDDKQQSRSCCPSEDATRHKAEGTMVNKIVEHQWSHQSALIRQHWLTVTPTIQLTITVNFAGSQ